MKLKVFTVDAFTSEAFSGNPAAIILLDNNLPDEILQKIATEINLSETAYLVPLSPGGCWKSGSLFGLRWFTPLNEVILCGHATLAAAHTLFVSLENTSDCLKFETLSGTLLAKKNEDDSITLDFPDNNPSQLSAEDKILFNGIVDEVRKNNFKIEDVEVSKRARKILVRISDDTSKQQFESFQPDDKVLLSLHDGSVIKGLILTMKGSKSPANGSKDYPQYNFVSRYFAVWNGISEDPVTGSAHTVLGPYWKRHLNISTLKCRQCSPRGGDLTVTVREDGRVDLKGHAVTVINGEINF